MKVSYYLYFALFLFFISCEDPTDVGAAIIPDGDALQADSLAFNDFVLNNFRDDQILNSNTTTVQLGDFNNTTFGKSSASYYTEVYYSGGFNEVEDAVLDSMVLTLNVSNFDGEKSNLQTINIYQMAEQLKSSTSTEPNRYYIYETVAKGDLIQQLTDVSYNTLHKTVSNPDSSNPDTIRHIKTHLPTAFAQSVFDKLNDTETTAESFQSFLNGFVFEPANDNSTAKGWFAISTNVSSPSVTGLSVYYHDAEGTEYSEVVPFGVVNDSTNSDNEFVPGAQNMNPIINTYSQAESQLQTQLDNELTDGYEQGYLQAGNGTYMTVNFAKMLDDFAFPNPTINLAELTIQVDLTANLSDTLYLPSTAFLAERFVTNDEGEKTGAFYGIDGSGLSNTTDKSRFDSRASAFVRKTDTGKYEYLFVMPKTIQSMVDGIITPELILLPSNRVSSFDGFKFAKTDTELKIFYTKTE